jgi:hypothetical protein
MDASSDKKINLGSLVGRASIRYIRNANAIPRWLTGERR